MQRKSGYPVANCTIKMPDSISSLETMEEDETPQRRQQLINYGHAQWGFNNWSWAVSRQDLDFVDSTCGKYTAGVAAFVAISVKTYEIHRENVGYGTAMAQSKGLAIHRARKCAVTNALRETLLSFGGTIASELLELDVYRETPAPEPLPENNPNLANKNIPPSETKHSPLTKNTRKEDAAPQRPSCPPAKNAVAAPPPMAKALPMPANLPPAANRPPQPQPQPQLQPQPQPQPQLQPQPQVQPQQLRASHPAQTHPHAAHPRSNSNEVRGDSEDVRAERKRRQRLAQEEFRLKQLQRQGQEEKQELDSISTSVDNLLMAIPTQDVNTKQNGNTEETVKRKSPALDCSSSKRRATALTRHDMRSP